MSRGLVSSDPGVTGPRVGVLGRACLARAPVEQAGAPEGLVLDAWLWAGNQALPGKNCSLRHGACCVPSGLAW